jgi:hypothetical protein
LPQLFWHGISILGRFGIIGRWAAQVDRLRILHLHATNSNDFNNAFARAQKKTSSRQKQLASAHKIPNKKLL